MQTHHAILISAFVTLVVGLLALRYNHNANRKHRNIIAVMQLAQAFYQDTAFSTQRLKLWIRLKELPDAEHDYAKIISFVSNDRTAALKCEEVVALNRTAAFYHAIKGLIESKEADVEMIRRFFGYNYNRFWNPERAKFVKYSSKGYDARFFQEIPELKQELSEFEPQYPGGE